VFSGWSEIRQILAEVEEDPYSDKDAADFLRRILKGERQGDEEEGEE
jgi:hypothetical protein